MQLHHAYPGDAIGGADYLTGSAQGEVVVDPDTLPRPELVIITDRYIEHEGRVCIGERSVRHMAHLLGMFEKERVEAVAQENVALHGEVDVLRAQIEQQRDVIEGLRLTQTQVFYVNGTRYETEAAAREASKAKKPPLRVPAPDASHEEPSTDPEKRGLLGRLKKESSDE